MSGESLIDVPVAKYGVHYVWVDLQAGRHYGERTMDIYNKALKGTAGCAPVGVWDENGAYVYASGFEPSQQELDLLRSTLQKRDLSTWVEQWDTRRGTWNDRWGLTTSHLPLEALLTDLRSKFATRNPPVPAGAEIPVQTMTVSGTSNAISDDAEAPHTDGVDGQRISPPAMRFVLAQSWWIASELVRRHPELIIHETHPGGGMYDCLELFTLEQLHSIAALNRAGTIHVTASPGFNTPWERVLSAESPHVIMKEIEQAASLRPPTNTPASTKRVLAYRFIAAAVHTAVNDRHFWDARNDFIDTADAWPGDPEVHGYLAEFRLAQSDAESAPRLGLWHEPESHFWALLRDEQPVALVSIEGKVYTKEEMFDIGSLYSARRSMTMVVAKVLSDYL